MPSDIFNNLLNEQISNFKNNFSNQARKFFVKANAGLIHPGEFGIYREQLCKNLLKLFTPEAFKIDTGFVITANNEISTQSDIIIFNPTWTPLIKNDGLQRFFPIETVLAVGEIKSGLSKNQLFKALKKISEIKQYRCNIVNPTIINNNSSYSSEKFDPYNNPHNQVFTFLICDKFKFNPKLLALELSKFYTKEKINYWLRHNVILSLEDGLWFYIDKSHRKRIYPFSDHKHYLNFCLFPDKTTNLHIRTFCHGFFNTLANSTTLFPEMGDYLDSKTISAIDEEMLAILEEEKEDKRLWKEVELSVSKNT